MASCGGSSQGIDDGVGTSRAERRGRPVELTLRGTSGEWIHLGDLRGKPVLLFLMATFDGVSQAALRPTSRFVRHHAGELHVLGVAVQPNPQPLLVPYVDALQPPFPFTYQMEGTIGEGTSALGALEAIPTYVMLDAYGVEVDRHVGFPNTSTLDVMLQKAIDRGGITEDGAPPPLIGHTPD